MCLNDALTLALRNLEKCHFMVNLGILLRHVLSERGIEVDKSKIDLICSLPPPTSIREVRSSLAGSYRKFIKNSSKIELPTFALMKSAR